MGSSFIKPFVWIFWFNFILIAVLSYFKGTLSFEAAAFRTAVVSFLLFAWTIGLHQYVFSILTPGSTVATQAKALLMRVVSSLFYFVIFISIFFFDETNRTNRAFLMTALSIMSLVWAFILYRRIHLIEDTPHSTLSSAAQGYSVLTGEVSLYENEVIRAPHRDLPVMVWYRRFLFISSAGFLLHDDKGFCTIDPRDAEVITPYYRFGSYAYFAIYPKETLYVIGQLETLSKQRTEFERRSMITAKIIEWKRYPLRFLDYFDKDRNGYIDDFEMENARQTATRFVDDSLEEVYLQPASHVVSRPADGRPFILSSIHPDDLIIRYKRAMFIHLAAWLTLGFFVFLMQVH